MLRKGKTFSLFYIMLNTYSELPVFSLRPTLRREILLRQHNKCGLCHCEFSMMRPHEIHHLNHNPKDNNSSNLLALCANCHAAHHRFGVAVMPFFEYRNTSWLNNVESDGNTKAYYE